MTDINNPTPTIEQLLAIEACREAARRYSYGVDRLDADTMKSAYWPDAIDEHGSFVGNAHEFADYCIVAHLRWSWTMHSIYTHQIDLGDDGVSARGEIYNITHLCRADTGAVDIWYGRYLDEYVKRGDEWRIIHRAPRPPRHPTSTRRSWPSTRRTTATAPSTGRPTAAPSARDAPLRERGVRARYRPGSRSSTVTGS